MKRKRLPFARSAAERDAQAFGLCLRLTPGRSGVRMRGVTASARSRSWAGRWSTAIRPICRPCAVRPSATAPVYVKAYHIALLKLLKARPAGHGLRPIPRPSMTRRCIAAGAWLAMQVKTQGLQRARGMLFRPRTRDHWASCASRNFTDRQRINALRRPSGGVPGATLAQGAGPNRSLCRAGCR